jgi:large subunit ribosomal protein L23Ae
MVIKKFSTKIAKITKPRYDIKFHKPKTKKLIRKPKYPKKFPKESIRKRYLKVIKCPDISESSLKKVASANTLVFRVNPKSNKIEIKHALKKLFKGRILKINTLINLKGNKKAFIKLSQDCDALDVSNKLGFL